MSINRFYLVVLSFLFVNLNCSDIQHISELAKKLEVGIESRDIPLLNEDLKFFEAMHRKFATILELCDQACLYTMGNEKEDEEAQQNRNNALNWLQFSKLSIRKVKSKIIVEKENMVSELFYILNKIALKKISYSDTKDLVDRFFALLEIIKKNNLQKILDRKNDKQETLIQFAHRHKETKLFAYALMGYGAND